MLSSPGNSPRHITYSPSLHDSSKSSKTPKNNQNNVLDEDKYVASIEKIIERDFYPDLPKLRDRLDWLEATRSRDPLIIKDVQLKILERRGGKVLRADAEAKSKTPGMSSNFFTMSATPFDFDKTQGLVGEENTGNNDDVDVSVSLDQFFRRYTSEDNHSFSEIVEKDNRKRKERDP
ncbi:hypothetical protein ACHQM5_000994 [Ranunculus cassubicifolius]